MVIKQWGTTFTEKTPDVLFPMIILYFTHNIHTNFFLPVAVPPVGRDYCLKDLKGTWCKLSISLVVRWRELRHHERNEPSQFKEHRKKGKSETNNEWCPLLSYISCFDSFSLKNKEKSLIRGCHLIEAFLFFPHS